MSTHRPRRAPVIALSVLLMAGCADADDRTGAPTPESSTSAETEPGIDEPSGGDDEPSEGDDVPTGWQEVDFGSGTFAVPPDWEIETYEAFGEQRERALYGIGHCPDDEESATGLAFTGWVPGETDAEAAVAAEAQRMAASAFGSRSPEVELSDLEAGGGWVGGIAAVTLEPTEKACAPVEAIFVIKAASVDGGTFVVTVVGELGLEASPTPDELVDIANTVRI